MWQTTRLAALLIITGTISTTILFRHHHSVAASKILAGTLIILTLLLTFIFPVRCRVTTTVRGTPCRRWSYGVLFGCRDIPGHWSAKFLARFNRNREARISSAPPTRRGEHMLAMEQQAITVTVEDGGIGTCTFWFALISTMAGVASVVLPIAGIH